MGKVIPQLAKQPKRVAGSIWRRLWGRLRWHTKLIAVIAAFAMILQFVSSLGGAFSI